MPSVTALPQQNIYAARHRHAGHYPLRLHSLYASYHATITRMIGRLAGTLSEKNPPQILLDCQGVGYEVEVPMSTLYQLPVIGQAVTLHTHMAVRDDGHFLYGFLTLAERSLFRQLLKISGIGARTALAVLSSSSVEEFRHTVAQQDVLALIRIPGIGKKTAERLLLELRDRLTAEMPTVASVNQDILQALLALGYRDKEITPILRTLPSNVSLEEGLRLCLKSLAKP